LSVTAGCAIIQAMVTHEVRHTHASGVPTRAEAEAIARDFLGDQGTRLAHVHTAGSMADRLGVVLFGADEAALLVAAATLHDVGYSPRIAQTGFHPLDGALYLRSIGLSERLCSLVAHHSEADLLAAQHGVLDLDDRFPRERSLLADALVYADMHSAPDGRKIRAEHRLADIARRRPNRVEAVRATRLRAAMARVGAALEAHAVHRPDGHTLIVPGPRDAQVVDVSGAEDRYSLALDG
jgi:hypothetical protein